MTPASERPCPSGKIPYPSRSAATRAAGGGHAKNKKGRGRASLEPYRCPSCPAWHLSGSKPTIPGYRPGRPMPLAEALAELERLNRERTER